MNCDEGKVLFEKDGMKFSKITNNKYSMIFSMENKNIILSNVINLNLIKLVYDLNTDIYDSVLFEKINENEANVTLLLKNFFEDLGLPQKYAYIHISKCVSNNTIIFNSKSIQTIRPKDIPENAEILLMKDNICLCEIITPHMVDFSFTVSFENKLNIPIFVEKMIGIILNKIFKRVKQFIEKITV